MLREYFESEFAFEEDKERAYPRNLTSDLTWYHTSEKYTTQS